jgi:hypothetical protein
MKTPEDEAFDDLARRQGAWGGGYQAKRQAAMDKINSHFDAAYKKMHEDRAMYGTSWSKDGERIDPTSVYLEQPAHCQCTACKDGIIHASDCAVHNGPAYPAGECDCGVAHDPDALTIAYQSGYHDGKKAALAGREWNFCERCGKRTADKTVIHTCTLPQEGT